MAYLHTSIAAATGDRFGQQAVTPLSFGHKTRDTSQFTVDDQGEYSFTAFVFRVARRRERDYGDTKHPDRRVFRPGDLHVWCRRDEHPRVLPFLETCRR